MGGVCWNADNPNGQCKDYKVNYVYLGDCQSDEEEKMAIQEKKALEEKAIEDLLFSLLTDEK